ncbi:MAG: glycosyltransferase [Chloroflexi bacterium]|nr:MAG: glycosyltransferase [Chloroflexota bacterium]
MHRSKLAGAFLLFFLPLVPANFRLYVFLPTQRRICHTTKHKVARMMPTLETETTGRGKRTMISQQLLMYQQGFVPFHPPQTQVRPQFVPEKNRVAPTPDLSHPKILLYSHDTFGLGNIRRTLIISQALIEKFPNAAILIVTGSPVIHAFRIPEGIDYIKLPCLDRVDANRYEPRFLREWSAEVSQTRQAILQKSILGFDPDLMIVDKRPAGIDGELLPALRAIRRQKRKTKLVVGIRDILDDPVRTRQALKKAKAFETIEKYYDEVWIYGMREVFDTAVEYGFPQSVQQKTFYCGYLQRPTTIVPRQDGPSRVLVTTGGGGDGGDIIEAYLEGLMDLPRRVVLRTLVMFGPQMPDERRSHILRRFGHLSDVTFRDFEPDLTQRYAEADLVVSMAGYNTVCELLSFGQKAVLVPREKPVREQLIRARLLAALGYFDLVEQSELTPQLLMEKVLHGLMASQRPFSSLDLGGLPRIQSRVQSLLHNQTAVCAD